jgi:hypothetical protein
LVAPELQLATEYLNTQTTNYLLITAFCLVPQPLSFCPALTPETVVIDTAAEMALANDSAALVDKVADRLLAGQISDTLRNEARAQVDRIPTTVPEAAGVRVAEAVYLISSSPEFARQR